MREGQDCRRGPSPEGFRLRIYDDLRDRVLLSWLKAVVLRIEVGCLDDPRGIVMSHVASPLTRGNVVSVDDGW